MGLEHDIKNTETYKEIQASLEKMSPKEREQAEAMLKEQYKRAEYFDEIFAEDETKTLNDEQVKWKFCEYGTAYDQDFDPRVNADYYLALCQYLTEDPTFLKNPIVSENPSFEKGLYIYGR